MKKIKVLHIADKFGVGGSNVHGVTRLFSWWIPRFDTDHFDVKLIGLRQPDSATRNLEERGVPVLSLSKHKFDFTTVGVLRKLIKDEKADLVHLHGYGSSNFGLMAAAFGGVKTVVHEHFVDPNYPAYQVPFDRILAPRADYAIAVSNSVRKFMIEKRHFRDDRITVIYNGAPLEDFVPHSREAVAEERARWGLRDDEIVLITVGRLDTQKGITYLLDAFKTVVARTPNCRLLIVGDGPLEQSLKQQCERLGLSNHVIFAGFQKNVALLQSMADMQVLPSLWEGLPLTLVEGMAMGLPIVGTTVDGIEEVLSGSEAGILVPPKDPPALAEAILRIVEHPGEAERRGALSHERSQAYEIRNRVRDIEQVYRKVLGLPQGT